jgi:hypothetical protein
MATPLGVKDFQNGDVITDTELNGYFMAQVIATFDDSAARTASIAAPAEGNFAYLRDTNQLTYYSGSVQGWQEVAGAAVGDSFLLMGA